MFMFIWILNLIIEVFLLCGKEVRVSRGDMNLL